MQLRKPIVALVSLVMLLLLGAKAPGQTTTQPENPRTREVSIEGAGAEAVLAGRPALAVQSLPELELTLDGMLSETVWETADAIANLATVEPEVGAVSAGQTIVKVLANPNEIIIGVLCHDPDPAGIVSFSKARDSELDDEDHVLIVLDTFLDGRSGYVFAVNPSGTLFDGLVSAQGTDVNSNWDALWEAQTSRDSRGWSTEIRIPVKSLGFKTGLTSWGLNVERRIQRLQETSRWSGVSQDYEIFQTSRAGVLTNLPNFDLGLGLSIRPAITTGGERPSSEASTTLNGAASLDVTQKLGTNLLASLTVNTDFAETEVDARQTNLSRFEILFPEKRTFFLEGADIFEFGVGIEEVLIPFFSRRVGLGEDGVEIPINAGGKVNGRMGNTNLGGLVVNTRHVASLDAGQAMIGAARVKQNIFAESSLGFIATVGDQLGRSGSWMTGVDFTYQTSAFREDKNLIAGAWGLVNDRSDLEGQKHAYGFGVDYPNDRWNFELSSARIGDGFDPSLGFVPRHGVHVWDGAAAFEPRPEWGLVRQMSHGVSLSLVNDLDYQWESYEMRIKPFDWQFESGDRLGFSVVREGDRPDEDFDVFERHDETVSVPAGSYEWRRYVVSGSLAEKRAMSGEIDWQSGGFYGGDLDTVEATLALKHSFFKLELGAERNVGRLPDGEFTQNLYSGRVELKFSPALQVASFVQFDNESDSLGTNTRLRWTYHPVGDLFIVYNHNLQRSIGDRSRTRWNFDSNALLVKLQHAWRP